MKCKHKTIEVEVEYGLPCSCAECGKNIEDVLDEQSAYIEKMEAFISEIASAVHSDDDRYPLFKIAQDFLTENQ